MKKSELTKEHHDKLLAQCSTDPELRQFLIDNKFMNEDGTSHQSVIDILETVNKVLDENE